MPAAATQAARPLGVRVEGREFVPDDAELAAIARIRELHAGGASLREIIAALDAEGHATKRGGRWYPSTVRACWSGLLSPDTGAGARDVAGVRAARAVGTVLLGS